MKSKFRYGSNIGLAFWSALAFSGLAAAGASAAQAQRGAHRQVLAAGTVIPVKLQSELSSSQSQAGDRFTAVVDTSRRPYNGIIGGGTIEGNVVDATPKAGDQPGLLDLAFTRFTTPDGQSSPIRGSLISMDNNSVTARPDGMLVAKSSHKKDQLKYAGIGAGVGALAGVLGNGKLKIGNILLGAALGYGASQLTKGHDQIHDVVLNSGTEIGVRLDSRLAFNRYRSAQNYGAAGYVARVPTQGAGSAGVTIDGSPVQFFQYEQPILQSGHVMIPVRSVLSALKDRFSFDPNRNEITASGSSGTVRAVIGQTEAVVDGSRRVRMPMAVERRSGVFYAPARFFDLVTGYATEWDAPSRTLNLVTH